MTRKDYELIAAAIVAARAMMLLATDDERTPKNTLDVLTYQLVQRLRYENDKFNGAKFIAAAK
jgi:hypothetical protein